jgi:hypothetical protein
MKATVFDFIYFHQIGFIILSDSEGLRVNIDDTLNEAVSDLQKAKVAHSKAPNKIILFASFIVNTLSRLIRSED